MKIIFFIIFIRTIFTFNQDVFNFLQTKNPDQALQAGGGDSGDFKRRDEPQEHIIIPLINTKEADYNPWVAPDIRKYRKEALKPDKDLEFQVSNS